MSRCNLHPKFNAWRSERNRIDYVKAVKRERFWNAAFYLCLIAVSLIAIADLYYWSPLFN